MGNSPSSSCVESYGDITKKNTERGESESMMLRYAVSEMKGHRQTMEDKHIHILDIPVKDSTSQYLKNHGLFGVFDGHGGDFTSRFLAANFQTVFSERDELRKYMALPDSGNKGRQDANAVSLLQKALVNTFLELDEMLLVEQKERTEAIRNGTLPVPDPKDVHCDEASHASRHPPTEEKSGSTAVVVLISPSHIVCANTGDSRAMIRRCGKTLPLSFDHKPSELPEKVRINTFGGFVKGKRVNGDLAVSRAFGDFMYKDNDKENYGRAVASKQKLIVTPDVIVYPRDHGNDEFLVLACDGVWDVASSKQLSEFVYRMLADGEVDLGNICEESLDTCLDRQSRDNMTMMLVSLPGIKMDSSASAALNNVLWGHRTQRHARNATYTTLSAVREPCTALSLGQPVVV